MQHSTFIGGCGFFFLAIIIQVSFPYDIYSKRRRRRKGWGKNEQQRNKFNWVSCLTLYTMNFLAHNFLENCIHTHKILTHTALSNRVISRRKRFSRMKKKKLTHKILSPCSNVWSCIRSLPTCRPSPLPFYAIPFSHIQMNPFLDMGVFILWMQSGHTKCCLLSWCKNVLLQKVPFYYIILVFGTIFTSNDFKILLFVSKYHNFLLIESSTL